MRPGQVGETEHEGQGEKGRSSLTWVLRAASCTWAPALEVVGHPASQRQGADARPPGRCLKASRAERKCAVWGGTGLGERACLGPRALALVPVGLPRPHPTPAGSWQEEDGAEGGGGGAGSPESQYPWVYRPRESPHLTFILWVRRESREWESRTGSGRSSFSHSSLAVTLSGPMVPRTMLPLVVAAAGVGT